MDDILDTWNTARIRAEIEKEEGKPADTNAPAVVKKKVYCSKLVYFYFLYKKNRLERKPKLPLNLYLGFSFYFLKSKI